MCYVNKLNRRKYAGDYTYMDFLSSCKVIFVKKSTKMGNRTNFKVQVNAVQAQVLCTTSLPLTKAALSRRLY